MCEHTNIQVRWSVFHWADDAIHTLHLQAHCASCMTPFRFLGDVPLAKNIALGVAAQPSLWRTGDGMELGARIAPMTADEMEWIQVEGRA